MPFAEPMQNDMIARFIPAVLTRNPYPELLGVPVVACRQASDAFCVLPLHRVPSSNSCIEEGPR